MLWLLHGNLGSPADWKPVMDFLRAGGVEARALNLWRYLECCPKSLKDMGRVLCSEIASQDRHPLICGYSLGGRLAMQAVLAHPPLWKGAIFVSANPGLEHEEERAARRAKDAEWAVQCLSAPWENFLKEWDAQGVFEGSPPPPDRSSLKPWRKSISRAFIDWSVGAQENLAPLLKQSPVPQLWIAGQRDARFSALARRMARGQAVIIPHAGHRLPLETPERLAECLQPFILQNL
ncbi:alpha/beta fold hydrolase [Akkermansia muciniphila]|uniref:alpha/beta fold hydrolase n=1 Tax=Akkermansia muciniphila TaxID=239935 RepID=UPI000C9B768A|nr:alpha/beta fold hydrolase [Akkermansia muciniphila]PNC83618.1 hypothetical protein CXT93_08835 [Akkermansia muciniphila]PNC97639.1 hypothetical protein CXT87_09635 [Akkermansia muciniphila]PND06456.1 hypothetical protein CXT86_03685 [Akkermansia muciniphila]PND10824.1 hypothetical protein CXT85_04555 [Akkermansia muciniphila]QBH16519.1 alpha/beta fold hydrolase [Akkermansia muciniphila]